MSKYYDEPTVTVVTKPALSLSTIGIITGIVLSILQGVGTINIGWFWATFPFWIVPAISLSIIIVAVIITFIVVLIEDAVDKRR